MIVPGPKTTTVLQKLTETASTTSDSGSGSYADLVTFDGSLESVSADERIRFSRETEESIHGMIIGYEEIGDTFALEMKAKNRMYMANADNALAAETFDIVSVEPQRYPGNKIATFEVILRKVL